MVDDYICTVYTVDYMVQLLNYFVKNSEYCATSLCQHTSSFDLCFFSLPLLALQ